MKTCLRWFFNLLNFLASATAVLAQETCKSLPSDFKPGQSWLYTDGVHINAHGGGMLYYNSKITVASISALD